MLLVAVGRVLEPAAGERSPPTWLGASERRRWQQIGPRARAGFVASRALLRGLLQSATGVPAAAWDVSAEPGVAPVASSSGTARGVRVSLSHRLGWVAAAVADVAVGVDVECDRPVRSDPGERAELMLSPGELIEWRAMAAGEREAALLARWTAKEAWFKSCPPQAAPWDFRRVHASPRAPAGAGANVRTWRATPVHVALCCGDAVALAGARCDGLPTIVAEASWHVGAVALPHRTD